MRGASGHDSAAGHVPVAVPDCCAKLTTVLRRRRGSALSGRGDTALMFGTLCISVLKCLRRALWVDCRV